MWHALSSAKGVVKRRRAKTPAFDRSLAAKPSRIAGCLEFVIASEPQEGKGCLQFRPLNRPPTNLGFRWRVKMLLKHLRYATDISFGKEPLKSSFFSLELFRWLDVPYPDPSNCGFTEHPQSARCNGRRYVNADNMLKLNSLASLVDPVQRVRDPATDDRGQRQPHEQRPQTEGEPVAPWSVHGAFIQAIGRVIYGKGELRHQHSTVHWRLNRRE